MEHPIRISQSCEQAVEPTTALDCLGLTPKTREGSRSFSKTGLIGGGLVQPFFIKK